MKSRAGKRQREETVQKEKIRRKKMQMREKVGKSRFTVFFQWLVAPEGRKVGSLKRRVRRQLARWEMKKCTPLWREAHFQVKMYKTPHGRTTFGSWDVEKVHAVVARSTFPSENVQNTPGSDHFWKLRCRPPCNSQARACVLCAKLLHCCCSRTWPAQDPGAMQLQANSSHPALHTSHLHFISTHLIWSLLISAKFFLAVFISSEHSSTFLISPKLVSTHLGSSARQSTTSYYKACAEYFPVLLCNTKLAQSTSQYYFVLRSLQKALPSTTLYYKPCTKYVPVLLCTTKLAQRKLLHREAFTHNKLLRREAFTHSKRLHTASFYTQQAFTHRTLLHKVLLHMASVYTHTQKLLHRGAFTHREAFTHSKLLHKTSFTHSKLLQEKVFTQRSSHCT